MHRNVEIFLESFFSSKIVAATPHFQCPFEWDQSRGNFTRISQSSVPPLVYFCIFLEVVRGFAQL